MELGDVCWVVGYGCKKWRTRVVRVIDAHPGRSSVMVKTEAGDYVPGAMVFAHEPFQVTKTDDFGDYTTWV